MRGSLATGVDDVLPQVEVAQLRQTYSIDAARESELAEAGALIAPQIEAIVRDLPARRGVAVTDALVRQCIAYARTTQKLGVIECELIVTHSRRRGGDPRCAGRERSVRADQPEHPHHGGRTARACPQRLRRDGIAGGGHGGHPGLDR